jgi:hypothetical protein
LIEEHFGGEWWLGTGDWYKTLGIYEKLEVTLGDGVPVVGFVEAIGAAHEIEAAFFGFGFG